MKMVLRVGAVLLLAAALVGAGALFLQRDTGTAAAETGSTRLGAAAASSVIAVAGTAANASPIAIVKMPIITAPTLADSSASQLKRS